MRHAELDRLDAGEWQRQYDAPAKPWSTIPRRFWRTKGRCKCIVP